MSQDSNELPTGVLRSATYASTSAASRNNNQLLTSQSSSFPLTQQPSTGGLNLIERSSTLSSANSAGRRLQIVLVLDKKVQKSLRVREMACADIEAVANSLNVNLQVINLNFLSQILLKILFFFFSSLILTG